MKKFLSFVFLFVALFLFSGCEVEEQDQPKTDFTNAQKLALIQEVEQPTISGSRLKLDLDVDGKVKGQSVKVDLNIDSYNDLKTELLSYTTFNATVDTETMDINARGNLYVADTKAYLDFVGGYSVQGVNINLDSKEVMDIQPLLEEGDFDIDEIETQITEIWEEIAELKYEEETEDLDEFFDLVSVTEYSNKTVITITFDKDILVAFQDSDEEVGEIISQLSDTTDIELKAEIVNDKIDLITLNGEMGIVDGENSLAIKLDFSLDFTGEKPTLPTTDELNSYTEVEVFSILANLFG